MKLFYSNVKNSVGYALSDPEVILVIGCIFLITSIVNKYVNSFHVSNVIMIVATGYGSFITWHTLNSSNKPPKIRELRMLAWEGLKKSIISGVYSIFLTFFIHHAKSYFAAGNYLLMIISAALFFIFWLFLVGGLVNRYLHDGDFF